MASFSFQLDGVLRHRRHLEQQLQKELALVQAQMHALQSELQSLDQAMRQATADVRANHLSGALDMNFLMAHRRFITGMQRKAMSLAQRMALLQRQLDEARAALAEAAKQRKIIEKLRERQYQRWLDDRNRREAAEIDEIGMQLAYRQISNP